MGVSGSEELGILNTWHSHSSAQASYLHLVSRSFTSFSYICIYKTASCMKHLQTLPCWIWSAVQLPRCLGQAGRVCSFLQCLYSSAHMVHPQKRLKCSTVYAGRNSYLHCMGLLPLWGYTVVHTARSTPVWGKGNRACALYSVPEASDFLNILRSDVVSTLLLIRL